MQKLANKVREIETMSSFLERFKEDKTHLNKKDAQELANHWAGKKVPIVQLKSGVFVSKNPEDVGYFSKDKNKLAETIAEEAVALDLKVYAKMISKKFTKQDGVYRLLADKLFWFKRY